MYIWLDQTLLAVTANKLFVTQPAWSRSRTLIECVLHYQYTIIWNASMLPYFLASCLDTPTTKNSMTPGELSKTSRKIDIRLTILYIMHHVPTYLWRNLCDIQNCSWNHVGCISSLLWQKSCNNPGHRLEKRKGDTLHIWHSLSHRAIFYFFFDETPNRFDEWTTSVSTSWDTTEKNL